jgi:hypothetical protein
VVQTAYVGVGRGTLECVTEDSERKEDSRHRRVQDSKPGDCELREINITNQDVVSSQQTRLHLICGIVARGNVTYGHASAEGLHGDPDGRPQHESEGLVHHVEHSSSAAAPSGARLSAAATASAGGYGGPASSGESLSPQVVSRPISSRSRLRLPGSTSTCAHLGRWICEGCETDASFDSLLLRCTVGAAHTSPSSPFIPKK